MSRFNDLTGKRFGKLICLRRVESDKPGVTKWLCQCDCGNKHVVRAGNLKSGDVRSCGCIVTKGRVKHGESRERLYHRWLGMKQRCYDPNVREYKHYGERGIKVCDEWLHDYKAFKAWAYANGYDDSLPGTECSLDRIDNNGNYEPSNCRWVDMKTQRNNSRQNRYITINGETKTVSQWADIYGLKESTVFTRIHRSYPLDEVFGPLRKKGNGKNGKHTA